MCFYQNNLIFTRKIDKEQIPTCNIMGVHIAAINMTWLLNFTAKYIKKLSGDYMCVSNVHTTVTAFENKDYQAVQNGGIMSIPDGGPLSSIGRKRGYKAMHRITGPDYMDEVFKLSVTNSWTHFFYGSTEDTLHRIKERLTCKYPGIQIAGLYSPPFRPMTKLEDYMITEKINSSKPDFLWIGLGAPRQELWMAEHQGRVNGFMIGVGAGFDYLAGSIKRAPQWMQKSNLEWLYRLYQEPGRLFYRYWHSNIRFIWHAYVQGK